MLTINRPDLLWRDVIEREQVLVSGRRKSLRIASLLLSDDESPRQVGLELGDSELAARHEEVR
jgi:hypothetical protein